MPAFDRTLWRLAGKIHRRLGAAAVPSRQVDLAAWRFAELQTAARRLAAVSVRGWPLAYRHAGQQLRSQLRRYVTHLQGVDDTFSRPLGDAVPTQRFLYDELQSLAAEFEGVEFDLRQETITVTTPSITLEEIYLGEFHIVLAAQSLPTLRLRVIAATPCPAASRPEVTHPHVSQEQLCEGDATGPLHLALKSGRLGDFFQIVQCTLQTYNDSSPYVALEEWTGTSCRVCDASVARHETYYCELCEEDVCEACSHSCGTCRGAACANCTDTCSDCDDYCCRKCVTPCHACQEPCCPNCLTQKLCEDCHAAQIEEQAEATVQERDSSSQPAIHPDGLGQVALPAGCR